MGNVEKFDSIANQYDTSERIEIANIISGAVCKYIVDGEDKAAIDYGSGTGLVGLGLVESFKSMLFVDASPNMIEQVRQKIEKLQLKNAAALCCNFTEEIPQGLQADYIIVVLVLLHEENVKLLLTRLFSILNEGGHLLIVDFDKNINIVSNEVHNGFEQQELIGILREISFSNIEAKTFYQGDKIFMNQDASLFIIDAIK